MLLLSSMLLAVMYKMLHKLSAKFKLKCKVQRSSSCEINSISFVMYYYCNVFILVGNVITATLAGCSGVRMSSSWRDCPWLVLELTS